MSDKLSKENVTAFLAELAELCDRHGLTIEGCGCCDSPYLGEVLDFETVTHCVTGIGGKRLMCSKRHKRYTAPIAMHHEYWYGVRPSVPSHPHKEPVCSHTSCDWYDNGHGTEQCCMCDYFDTPPTEAACRAKHDGCHQHCIRRKDCIPF